MNDSPIILVSGVSGVGKTKLCKRFVADKKGVYVNYVNAGEVAARLMYPDQVPLCRYVYANILAGRGPSIIDGHMCLSMKPVPVEALAELRVGGIIVLCNDPDAIEAYRNSGKAKSIPNCIQIGIKEEQDKEIDHAITVGRGLDVRVDMVSSSDYQNFYKVLTQRLGL